MNSTHVNILLADDDADDCLLFQEALDELPLSTALTVVHDGEKLMQLLLKNQDKLPHVLFIDLNMPRKNGDQCLTEIKQHQNLKQLPVIIYSTSFNRDIIKLLQQHGAQHYIRKPAEFCKLRNVVHRALLLISGESNFENGVAQFVIKDEGIPSINEERKKN